jgi:hypothetical protein
MRIYEAGRHDSAGRVNDSGRVHPTEVADRSYPIAPDSNVPAPAGAARAIDDGSVRNDYIVHVSILRASVS